MLAGTVALGASGCMTAQKQQELDTRYLAGWRPGKGYCLAGGETPLLDAYCAKVNFGDEGTEVILRDINRKVVQASAGAALACTDHVARVRQALAPYTDLESREVYSCANNPPMENGRAVCHVSLLVTDTDTRHSWVVDNGYALSSKTAGGVATYKTFVASTDRRWIGAPPSGLDLMVGGIDPASEAAIAGR